jgi:hypothetical protein
MAPGLPSEPLTEIRPASAVGEPAANQIRRETWLAAYAQIIDPEIIARLTAPGGPRRRRPAV